LNDKIAIEEIREMNPDGIILSPGPCTPKEAGICTELVKEFYNKIPIFGVCLGHQVIGEAFGSDIVKAKKILHGKTDNIVHNNQSIFSKVKPIFKSTRYHSLIIDKDSLSDDLEIIATSESDNTIMAIQHKKYPVFGVQVHPESYASECGNEIVDYFLNISKEVNHEHSKLS
ncbi:MAG: aminodeoxychorismate/anthranilate synthase component II, partial [Clostridiales bacterium]|nr:aminodeoxychorismate/anthranilate synthase component II [Clostridiales bacterium]